MQGVGTYAKLCSIEPRRLALWALLLVILVASTEIMLRVGTEVLGIDLDTSYGYPRNLFVADAELGFRLQPGFVGRFPNPPYDEIEIRINEQGYRDRAFPERSDRTRILVVGDSITFGAGIRAEERFTEQLQASLCRGGCEVLNAGVSSYQAANYLALLRGQIDALAPDWVIVGFCMNDIQPKAIKGEREDAFVRRLWSRIERLPRRSELFRVTSRIWRALTLDAEAYDQRWIRLAMAAWSSSSDRARLADTLREIRSLLEAKRAKLVVVLFPEKHQLESFDTFGRPYAQAEQMMAELSLPTISLLPVLSQDISNGELRLEDVYLPQDNIHFTPRVHARIADAIGRELGPMVLNDSSSR